MIPKHHPSTPAAWLGGALIAATVGALPPPAHAQAAFSQIGNIDQNGVLAVFEKVVNAEGGINVQKVVGLAACDTKALYAVEQDTQTLTTYPIWFSNDSGLSWKKTSAVAFSKEIACDHAQLLTLDGNKRLWFAPLMMNGAVGSWTRAPTTITVNRIQGGDGTFYGVKQTSSGNQVYVASNQAIRLAPAWSGPIATIGAVQVTGTGTRKTGTDGQTFCDPDNAQTVCDMIAWPRQAFALEASGTFSTNRTLLTGTNLWTGFATGSERYLTLSAAAPNVLFAIQSRRGVREINRIRIEESSCFDGQDNDANGLTDGEDPPCRQELADAFCANQANGNYCSGRFEPATFLGQPNKNTALITCTNRAATAIVPGACQYVLPGTDNLPSENKLAAAEPANTGRYCNVHWSDGSWGFNWTGSAPCSTLLRSKTGGTVVRAGLYSTTGANHVFVRCSNGGYGPLGASGTAPLAAAYNAVGKTTNRCIFQVSAGALPVFDKMFKSAHQLPYPGREALGFMHGLTPVPLEQFQNNQSGMGVVDRFGKQISDTREYAYDNPLNEGRPLYAPADGIVLMDGSRERDVTRFGNEGTPNQGEIYLKVGIGPSATYRETFIVYYAHVRRRMVADGQSVRRGQILGYVGATGATSGFAHLHTGVFRASNINARGTTPQFGYHVNFVPDDDDTGNNMGNWNAIDPLGWANGHAFDPWAYLEWDTAAGFPQTFTGLGGWSVNLFKPGQAFRYP